MPGIRQYCASSVLPARVGDRSGRSTYEVGNLFDASRIGMRVVVVRDDMSPVEFSHPALFRPSAPGHQSLAVIKAEAAAAAAKRAQDLRRASHYTDYFM